MEKKSNRFVSVYLKYVIVLILALVLTGGLLYSLDMLPMIPGSSSSKVVTTTAAPTENSTSDSYDLTLHYNSVSAVNQLMSDMFTARSAGDVDTLNTLVKGGTEITKATLDAENQYVEAYKDIECYTIESPTKGNYAVYVCYNIKFINITTKAPAMTRYYVCSNADGSMYINEGDAGSDAAFLTAADESSSVVALSESVDTALEVATGNDSQLKTLMELLNNGGSEETTEAATTATTQAATTEAATTASGSTVYATTNVNIRQSASTSSEIIGKLLYGESIEKVSTEGDWTKVSVNGGYGYIYSQYLQTTKPEGSAETTTSSDGFSTLDKTMTATANVRVRSEASTSGEILGMVYVGDSVKVTGYNGSWYKVYFEGKTGYVSGDYLK